MDLTHEVYNAVDNYFAVLKNVGYKSYGDVAKLIVFAFIEELLDSPMSEFVTEEDYKAITGGLYCLYGSCMIPFPDYRKAVDSTVHKVNDRYRITETDILRISQDMRQRTKA